MAAAAISLEVKAEDLAGLSGCIYVGVDIGATNTRVAVGRSAVFHHVIKFQCNTTSKLVDTLQQVEKALFSLKECSIVGATLDVAGPVSDNGTRVRLTNFIDGENVLTVDMLPAGLFPKGKTHLLNDLEAACYGIIALGQTNQLSEYFECLWGDAKVEVDNSHYAVLAMGTGLGAGLIQHMSLFSAVRFQVLALEGGHSLVPALGASHPNHKRNADLMSALSERLYGGKFPIEWEDVCSGRGLKWVYDHFVDVMGKGDKSLTTPDIARAAVASPPDEVAQAAMEVHYSMLARASQNLVVNLQAKGVFWAGDNQVHNRDFVVAHKDVLRAEFEDHPKKHWVNVPVFSQIKPLNINLLGVLLYSEQANMCRP